MASINFGVPPAGHRIEENPKACLKCHNPGGDGAAIDPRPNWQQYNQWTGFYGSEDDTFKAGVAELGENQVTWEQMSEQKENFLKFREKQKNNPCYSTLPTPPNPDELYPYGYQGRDPDYRRRPGLKFTEVQCHLTAKRLARKFREKPEYNLIKYALAMNSLKCEQFRPEQITQIIPEAKADNFRSNTTALNELTVDQSTQNTSLSAHFEVGRALGFRNADWTMHFNRPEKAGYICGINEAAPAFVYHQRDLTIGDVMQGELMKDLSKDVPALKDKIRTSPGERETFGNNFACIDQLGGAPGSDELNSYQVCQELASAQEKLEKEVITPSATRRLLREWQERRESECAQVRAEDNAAGNITDLITVTGNLGEEPKTPNAERGHAVVTGVCIHCHDGSMGMYDFFSNEEATKNHLKEDKHFVDRVLMRINSTSNPMPPTHPLSAMEKADLEAYLRTFLN
jgi:mono/diheme cytochrome c family protein